MSSGHLEHTNLTVSDPDRSASLFERLCGWSERWRGPSQSGGWTIHVGTPDAYIALYTDGGEQRSYAKGVPLNHVGLVVDDLDGAERVVSEAGLEPFGPAEVREIFKAIFRASLDIQDLEGRKGMRVFRADLVPEIGGSILEALVDRYVGTRESLFARRLLSRRNDEMAIQISPTNISSWDFARRMS